jgi:hypothetical protein
MEIESHKFFCVTIISLVRSLACGMTMHRNIGLWPVRPAGLQPAASPAQTRDLLMRSAECNSAGRTDCKSVFRRRI